MEELTLTIEGIKNKIQKLALQNTRLKERLTKLEEEKLTLEQQLKNEIERNSMIEQQLISGQMALTLDKTHSKQAKQKINEMLREIDKCYALLNR